MSYVILAVLLERYGGGNSCRASCFRSEEREEALLLFARCVVYLPNGNRTPNPSLQARLYNAKLALYLSSRSIYSIERVKSVGYASAMAHLLISHQS
jgi:hypothetical protein